MAPVLVEAAGIEPASREISTQASTCVVDSLDFTARGPSRQGPRLAIRERDLIGCVPDVTPDDLELVTNFQASPVKALSRGCLC